MDLYNTLKPLGRILDLSKEGWTVWDCSPVYGPDGRVHVFTSRWQNLDRPDLSWYRGSQIIHSVADEPAGPYTICDIVIDADGTGERHWDRWGVINPKIYDIRGRYYLLYTGCSEARLDAQSVCLLAADSLNGPWEPLTDGPLIRPRPDRKGFDGFLCNNPAIALHPDGRYFLYYKGRNMSENPDGEFPPGRMTIGLAIADTISGPYHRHPSNPLIDMEPQVEDPYVWHDGTVFRMIVETKPSGTDPAGWIMSSEDGIQWSDPEPGYPGTCRFLGRRQRLEEPNLLFKDDRPTHLFNVMGACPEDPVYSGHVFEIISGKE